MHTRAIFLAVALPALLVVSTWAQQSQKPSQPASEIQSLARQRWSGRADALTLAQITHPAFRLRATFSFVGNDSKTVAGTYREIWVSQWEPGASSLPPATESLSRRKSM
jgi:hypothetical protein